MPDLPPKCWPCGPDKSCPISGLGLQEVQLSPLRMRSGKAEYAPTSTLKAPVKPVGFEPGSLGVRGRRSNHYAIRASLHKINAPRNLFLTVWVTSNVICIPPLLVTAQLFFSVNDMVWLVNWWSYIFCQTPFSFLCHHARKLHTKLQKMFLYPAMSKVFPSTIVIL